MYTLKVYRVVCKDFINCDNRVSKIISHLTTRTLPLRCIYPEKNAKENACCHICCHGGKLCRNQFCKTAEICERKIKKVIESKVVFQVLECRA